MVSKPPKEVWVGNTARADHNYLQILVGQNNLLAQAMTPLGGSRPRPGARYFWPTHQCLWVSPLPSLGLSIPITPTKSAFSLVFLSQLLKFHPSSHLCFLEWSWNLFFLSNHTSHPLANHVGSSLKIHSDLDYVSWPPLLQCWPKPSECLAIFIIIIS